MAETVREWKEAFTHRTPKWPLAGYAPGGYMATCVRCEQQFIDMDKRAIHCFPCAIDAANECMEQQRIRIRELEAENETLQSAFAILARPRPTGGQG
ncbi:MAG: hypothetical protein KF810_17090 [Rhizobiaceae bacterium]|nr:hypothetical protein [Rhizobiaceae bacterium]